MSRRPLDPDADPVQQLAARLRQMKHTAAFTSNDDLAKATERAGTRFQRSKTTIRDALDGRKVPRWTTVQSISQACGHPLPDDELYKLWTAADAHGPPSTSEGATETVLETPAEAAPKQLVDPPTPAPPTDVRAATSGPAAEPSSGRRGRRAALRLTCLVVVLVALVVGVVFALARGQELTPVAGQVRCADGSSVKGVWVRVHPSDGGREASGHASWMPRADTEEVATFEHQVPTGASWSVNVGCGGSVQEWRWEVHGVEYTSRADQDWVCSRTGMTLEGCFAR